MAIFSLLLIEPKISVAATVVQTINQHLPNHSLIITKDINQILAKPEPADIILLAALQVTGESRHLLKNLHQTYPNKPVILLHSPAEPPLSDDQENDLLQALSTDNSEYISLSKIGLTLLGKRLNTLQLAWQERQLHQDFHQATPSGESVYQAIIGDSSQLAIQLIGPDNRILAWNLAAERLFGLKKSSLSGPLIENLPLSPANLDRFKDILDQVRSSGEPLFLSNFPLVNRLGETHWVQLHLYSIFQQFTEPGGPLLTNVCVICADVTDLKQDELHNQQYSQELQILLETSRQFAGRLELLPTLEKIIEQTKTLLNADNGRVYFLDKDRQLLQPVLSLGPLVNEEYPTAVPVGQGVIGKVAATGQAATANDTTPLPGQDVQHMLCAPLITLKEMMGVMVLSRINNPPFGDDDLRFFKSIVQQVSSAIYNARRFEETRTNLNELAVLYETSFAIVTARDTEAVLSTLVRQMVHVMDLSSGFIVSWNRPQNTGTIQAKFFGDGVIGRVEVGATFNLANRPWLSTLRQQQPIVFQLKDPALPEDERLEMETQGCLSRLLVPLVVKGETNGWADLWETRRERLFNGDEIRLARMLANQAAVALENVQYLKQTQQALEETDALYQVASTLASTQDAQTIMSIVLQEYLRALNLKQGSAIAFDFDTKTGVVKMSIEDDQPARSPEAEPPLADSARPAYGREGWEFSLKNNPIYERLMGTHRPVAINDTGVETISFLPRSVPPLQSLLHFGWAGPETFSLLVLPIQPRGDITGALVIEATRYPHTFTQAEISLGQAMVDQLGVGLQNVELFEAEYRRRQQAETLRDVLLIVGSSLNLDEVLEKILDQLGRVIKYDSAAIHLIENNRRRIIAGRGFPNPKKVIGMTFRPNTDDDQDPGMIALRKRQPLVVNHVPDSYNIFKKSPLDKIESWMGIPLIARDKAIGLITIMHGQANAYDEDDLQLALAFANQAAIALENARLYEVEVRELERELEIAQTIQETLLPQLVPQVPGLEISGRILPARHIGGDFFHFFPVGKDQLGVAIGDVSGKGIPAALYMAVAITAIDVQIRFDLAPGELLNRLNQILYTRLKENKMNIGLQVATFSPLPDDTSSDKPKPQGVLMTIASAGMIAPIGATEYGCRILPVGGLPVGALAPPEQNYQDDMFLLDPFTTIIFVSDGIVEAQNESRELFGFERLENAINEIISSRDAEVVADHIINRAQEFIGQAEQHDDMTVVVVVKK